LKTCEVIALSEICVGYVLVIGGVILDNYTYGTSFIFTYHIKNRIKSKDLRKKVKIYV